MCRGHFHAPGTLVPLSDFYVHRRGERKGKPFFECKRCWAWRRDNPPKDGRDHVPMQDALPVFEELFRRIGQTQAARRIGVAVDTISRRRLRAKQSIRRTTFDTALSVLEEAREREEDGWSTEAARTANLRPYEAGLASGEARRARALAKDELGGLKDWEYEMAMDAAYCEGRWAYDALDKGWPLADFECRHGRLPSDTSPPCGCWPEEEPGLTT